jgi:hypothetical protein
MKREAFHNFELGVGSSEFTTEKGAKCLHLH